MRFGFIGTNFISDWMIEGGRLDGRFHVEAIYSRTIERGREFAFKHGIPKVYTQLDQMLNDPDIDAVYVASPNACHAQQAVEAMRKGKHVLCEKSFASNAEQARWMVKEAEFYRVTLMEAMKVTLNPHFEIVRKAIPRVGVLRKYFASYCQYSSRYDRLKNGEILNAWKPELGNGALTDIGVYTLYPMVALFGKPDSVQHTSTKLYTGADGAGSIIMNYSNGMDAEVIYSKISDSYLPTEIQGESGNIVIDHIHKMQKVTFYPRGGEPEDMSIPILNEYYYEIKEFIDLVENGKTQSEVNTWENSIMTMEIMDAVRS